MMRLRDGALAFLAVGLLASCGGGADHAGMSDPRAVARAYTAAAFDCGERGAGKQYDLSISTSPSPRWPRDEYLRFERTHGCRRHPVPDLRVALIDQQADFAAVEVVATATTRSQSYEPERLLLVRVDGTWKIDTFRSGDRSIRP